MGIHDGIRKEEGSRSTLWVLEVAGTSPLPQVRVNVLKSEVLFTCRFCRGVPQQKVKDLPWAAPMSWIYEGVVGPKLPRGELESNMRRKL